VGFVDRGYNNMRVLQEINFVPLSLLLDRTPSFEELLAPLIKSLVETVSPADAGIVYLYDHKCRQLVAQASYGYHCDNIEYGLSLNEGAPGQCYALRKSLLFPSIEHIRRQTATFRLENVDCHTKMRQGLPPTLSMIAIPLALREKLFGVVLLEHYKQHRPFSETDVPQAESLASWISLIIDDVQLHLQLKHTKRSYRELLGRHITATEEECKKIAREMHDELNGLLLSVKLNLENIDSALPADLVEVRKVLEASQIRINQLVDEIRKMVLDLRPPALDDLGLPQALDYYIHNCFEQARLPITLEVSGLSQRRPAPVVETELFRIAQEALSNVIKHARASSAIVKLNFGESRLLLTVEDNGAGFDSSAILHVFGDKANLGLLGMQERAGRCGGTLKIDSTLGRGTRVEVEVPVSSYDWGGY
jgi:signal transduction histidine kinase